MNEYLRLLQSQLQKLEKQPHEVSTPMFATPRPSAPPGDDIQTFANPVIWEDLPDMDMIRVGDVYYMSASSFHYSPGAPVLRSRNLMDWEYIGHSIPELPGERFNLDGQHPGAYVKGVWASTMQYRKSNRTFYWYGPIQGTERTFIYTAKDPSDAWTPLPPINKFFYDLGLLIDEDDTMYLAYGTKTICVSQLSSDGTQEVKSSPVYTSDEFLEGARMYRIGKYHYIFLTRPYSGQYILKSSDGPFGPYECRQVVGEVLSPIPGAGHPHQGGLVDTPDGQWYYMAFADGYPCGRIPVLAPVTFDDEGWPKVEADYSSSPGTWRDQYPVPLNAERGVPAARSFGTDSFVGDQLDGSWQWNHNPDNSKWTLENKGLVLATATVTDNLYLAANTLTRRTTGPRSMITFSLDVCELKEGDRAGASIFRYDSAYIGIHKDAGVSKLVYVDNLKISPFTTPVGFSNGHPVSLDWKMESKGTIKAEAPLKSNQVLLRVKADVRAAHSHGYEKEDRCATFEFSYDDTSFTQLGPRFVLSNDSIGWMGYRFAVFNFATKALGGRIRVESCDVAEW